MRLVFSRATTPSRYVILRTAVRLPELDLQGDGCSMGGLDGLARTDATPAWTGPLKWSWEGAPFRLIINALSSRWVRAQKQV